MSGHGVLPGLWPIHGDGVLARQGDLVLLIHPAGGASQQIKQPVGEGPARGVDQQHQISLPGQHPVSVDRP